MAERDRDVGADLVVNAPGILVSNDNEDLLEEGGYVVGRRDQIRFATNRRDGDVGHPGREVPQAKGRRS